MALCCLEGVLRAVRPSIDRPSCLAKCADPLPLLPFALLPEPVVSVCFSLLPVSAAAACDAASRTWRELGKEAWRARCAYLTGQSQEHHGKSPKRVYADAAASAHHGLAFTQGHGFSVVGVVGLRAGAAGASIVSPASEAPWVATIGAPTCCRRFVSVRVQFAWSWCCRLGVLEVSDQHCMERIDLDSSERWHITVRPPSRYDEGTLAVEISDGRSADVRLRPRMGSPFVKHDAENSREATFGILIDFGRVTFFMRSTRGRWAHTGVVAECGGMMLVPFVANPLQQAEVLGIISPPDIPPSRPAAEIVWTNADQ